MGNVQATFKATEKAFYVEGYEKIDFSLLYVDGAFGIENCEMAESYRQFGRCLMVADKTVYGMYGQQMHNYFKHHEIDLPVFPIAIEETDKTLRTLERIVDAFAEFGLLRKSVAV